MTIHKSQGLTLEKAVISLGDKDFAHGLAFVAISRVKSLNGLAFKERFPISRLQKPIESLSMRLLNEDNARRANLQLALDDYGMDLTEYVFTE